MVEVIGVLGKMLLFNSVHLLDKTLVLSKPAVHCGEEPTEDDLPEKKGNNINWYLKREAKGEQHQQESKKKSQRGTTSTEI